jgi:hypothetical protein
MMLNDSFGHFSHVARNNAKHCWQRHIEIPSQALFDCYIVRLNWPYLFGRKLA